MKKAFGEVIYNNVKLKIDRFLYQINSMKGKEYNPERGDYAFIITPSTIPRTYLLKLRNNNIGIFFFDFKKIGDIPGLGRVPETRLNELDIFTIEDLLECNSKLIASRIKGIGVKKIEEWKKQAKALLEEIESNNNEQNELIQYFKNSFKF